jgi:ribosomal protein S18 acetylase RimI-like enzyme
MAEPLTVAEATADDAGAFAAFFWEAWQQAGPAAPGFAGATDEVIRELTTQSAIVERLGGPDRRMFLAWVGQRVVGFSATTRIDNDNVELAGIIVLQSTIGRGIGTALVAETVASCRAAGYHRMIVKTETDNKQALGFYEGLGFTPLRTTEEDAGGVTVDVWELERSL